MRLLPLFIYQYDYINWTANLHFFSDSYKKMSALAGGGHNPQKSHIQNHLIPNTLQPPPLTLLLLPSYPSPSPQLQK